MKNLSWRTKMFSKKVLIIGLMAVALMSYSIAALAEDKIFTSSLQTPPPGQVLEKSFGNFMVVQEHAAFTFINRNDILETIDKATKEFQELVKKLGGNAILAQKIDTQVSGSKGNILFILMQGEVVLLKSVSK
ncbi:MAG: hypothetical protein HZB81_05150 [Deltaproteobacteria bacterium]|nr:hypothetical protein [Deltaproteobacteria bacterium]